MAYAGEFSSAAKAEIYGVESERGGGGKLRRERKPPATPYDRPASSGYWISRFVDPAKRLLSGLPYVFSPAPSASRAVVDELQTEEEQEAAGDAEENSLVDIDVPKSTIVVSPSEVKGKSKVDLAEEDGLHTRGGCSDVVPDIEQIIKGKTFSREDIDHLMKILHSKVVDAEQDRNTPRMTGLHEVEKAEASSGREKTSVDVEEDLTGFQLATSTPFPQPAMQYEIGASPVDIARAYMGSRTSDISSLVPKTEKYGFSNDVSTKPDISSHLRKAPIRWPGAVTQNQLDYSSPQSRSNRSGLHSLSRTPYTRTVFSKSKSKLTPLLGDSARFPSFTPAPFQPTATPVYGKESIYNVAEGSYGSGGPVRRMRNKFSSATPSRQSTLFSTAQRSPLAKDSYVDFTPKKNFEPGSSSIAIFNSVSSKAKSPEAGVQSVHPHSSRLARQILEQIDRPVTVKQKSKELKLATSWKESSGAAPLATPVQNIGSSGTPVVNVDKDRNADVVKFSAQTNKEHNDLHQERVNSISGAGKDIVDSTTSYNRNSIFGAINCPSPGLKSFNSQRSPEKGINNVPVPPKTSLLFGAPSKAASITNSLVRSEPQNAHRKPILPSIAIEKSSMGISFSSVTSPGFTFPLNTSTTSAEPPTPSIIMPSFVPSAQQQLNISASLPTYDAAKKITIAPAAVSSPYTTKASNPNDVSTPKFKFGSGSPRLSFAIAGDDATSTPNDSTISKYKFGSGKSRLNFGSIGSSDAVCC